MSLAFNAGNQLETYGNEKLTYDANGNRTADGNGEVVANYEYDAWGNVLKSEATGIAADNSFGYAGYMYDKEIGMYYLIARYYNPEHGVSLSVGHDPGDEYDPVTQHGYTYTDNNPVMMTDPDGHAALLVINAAVAGYNAYNAYKAGKFSKTYRLANKVSKNHDGTIKRAKGNG